MRLSENSSADVNDGTPDELPVYLVEGAASAVWWVTFDDGKIIELCEQYVP